MATTIPAGYGIIPGRGRDKAQAALAAAEAAGFSASVVRTHREGYLVPNEVLDQYEADNGADRTNPTGEQAEPKANATKPVEKSEAPAEEPKDEKPAPKSRAKSATKKDEE